MFVFRSIIAGLFVLTATGTTSARAQSTVIFEGTDMQSHTIVEYDEHGARVSTQTRQQTLMPGLGSIPDLSHPQKGLILLVGPNHQGMSRESVRNLFEGPGPMSLKSFYERESAGNLTFAPFTYVYLPHPDFNGCYMEASHLLARYTAATGDRNIDFDHVFVLGDNDHSKCPGGTLPNGASGSLGNFTVSNQFGRYEFGMSWYSDQFLTTEFILNHEYGHSLGWMHSNLTSRTQHVEYGDGSDVMGSPRSADFRVSAARQWTMGWMNSARTVRTNEFGLPVTISRRTGPELLLVPLTASRLKAHSLGRTMLAIAFEPELPFHQGGLPYRRAGMVPRIVSSGLPQSAMSLFYDEASVGISQRLPDLVLDRVGSFALPEAGLTIIVDRVNANSAEIRILDTPAVPSPQLTLHPTNGGTGCYHRRFSLAGLNQDASLTAQSDFAGRVELMKSVGPDSGGYVAAFAGSGPLVISAVESNRDGGYTTYNLDVPADPTCTEQVPTLQIEQTRHAEVFSRECGLVTTSATNLGAPSTPIAVTSGSGHWWYFQNADVWNLYGVDSRQILTTYWFDQIPFQMIGTSVLGPVDCANQPVPKLQLKQPEVGADCRTVTVRVHQSATGIPQSEIAIRVATFGATGPQFEDQFCTIDGQPAGQSYCKVTFQRSLADKDFIVTASSPSDATTLHGELRCGSDSR